MSTRQKREILDIVEQADLLLISMKGQMQIAQERAEKRSDPLEYNDELHLAVMMKTMIDSVRAILDDAAHHVTQAAEA